MSNFSVQGLRPYTVMGHILGPWALCRISFPPMAKVTGGEAWIPSKHGIRYLIKGRKEGGSNIWASGRSEG